MPIAPPAPAPAVRPRAGRQSWWRCRWPTSRSTAGAASGRRSLTLRAASARRWPRRRGDPKMSAYVGQAPVVGRRQGTTFQVLAMGVPQRWAWRWRGAMAFESRVAVGRHQTILPGLSNPQRIERGLHHASVRSRPARGRSPGRGFFSRADAVLGRDRAAEVGQRCRRWPRCAAHLCHRGGRRQLHDTCEFAVA